MEGTLDKYGREEVAQNTTQQIKTPQQNAIEVIG